ncbi:hypothetical protein [Alteraurantiacibacter buctensis]|uniref:Uncharacterized protein n=1 Tax=Alteraurantiacibacter buctensis TaxID=1503981 RepID=A0A844YYH1_9SPHN|nr:hypothetical protein [Alteraurantiacibacter buctensis]MXO72076.1 hypothetical protein [Alteraurantiacibacter buctensis]
MLERPREGEKLRAGVNWWKYAFFVAIIAFELAREFAVLASSNGAEAIRDADLFHLDGYIRAEGTWRRSDGGERLLPGTVTIECLPEMGKCIEASVTFVDQYVSTPEIDWFDARFSADAVTYENNRPDCARYLVRLDIPQRRVTAVREKVPNASNPSCAVLEDRIEMELADGLDPNRSSFGEHNVPLLRAIAAVVNAF